LAAQADVLGVIIGSIVGHAACTGAAVLGGKHLAEHIDEKLVGVSIDLCEQQRCCASRRIAGAACQGARHAAALHCFGCLYASAPAFEREFTQKLNVSLPVMQQVLAHLCFDTSAAAVAGLATNYVLLLLPSAVAACCCCCSSAALSCCLLLLLCYCARLWGASCSCCLVPTPCGLGLNDQHHPMRMQEAMDAAAWICK
jgi:hypothetical protein